MGRNPSYAGETEILFGATKHAEAYAKEIISGIRQTTQQVLQRTKNREPSAKKGHQHLKFLRLS